MRTLLILLFLATPAVAQKPEYERKRDVIYGRKHGLAMTMDVFTPKKTNGRGLIFAVSGGWFSSARAINAVFMEPFLKRGYTVFAVVHGSQPKYTIPEILEDMHRAVRYIHFHSKQFKIDPGKLGIYGASAGGHLSLMQGTAGKTGTDARDPIDQVSSRVKAVACFFPPTDFLNWGKKGNELIDRQIQPPFTAAMDYHEFDRKKALFIPIKDKKLLREITKDISPVYHVSKDDAPTLIIHGDKDTLVPIQQAELFIKKMEEMKVPSQLVVREGKGHGWPTMIKDLEICADWFDKYLEVEK